jgi:hypothetical protein
MAGDWIKMRTNLDTDWRVIEMAGHLGIPELHVVGCLWKLWTWADQHTLDGNAIRVTSVTLDRFTGVTGFAEALRKVGWLDGRDNALSFPRFAEHNGHTAKNRAETNKRVAKHRNANAVTGVTQKPLPEKRREEKRREEDLHTHTRGDEISDVIIPDWVPQKKWSDYLEVWRVRHGNGRIMGGPTQETILEKLHGAYAYSGEAKALADLAFMIERQSKAYLDSANDFQKRGGGGSNGGGRKTRGQQAMENVGL